jgi:hypothetical protein
MDEKKLSLFFDKSFRRDFFKTLFFIFCPIDTIFIKKEKNTKKKNRKGKNQKKYVMKKITI